MNSNTILLFSVVIFFVSFFSDVVLNVLSNVSDTKSIFYSKIITSLKPYFREKSILYAGSLAGITVVLAFFGLLFLSRIVLGFQIPSLKIHTMLDFIKYFGLAFLLGYLIDIGIEKMDIFGKGLQPYYKVAGSGFWGAMAFVFAIGITYFVIEVFTKVSKTVNTNTNKSQKNKQLLM